MTGAGLREAELRRCLLAADLPGLTKIWSVISPHLAGLAPRDAMIAMHMARVEMRFISTKLRKQSLSFLAAQGLHRRAGGWDQAPSVAPVVAETVGIAAHSKDPRVAKRIHRVMENALLNGIAKGVTEGPMQRELMLQARAKERFKLKIA